jgi:hypothetical protein
LKSKEILFISYYLDPSNLVGAKRMSYWASNIENVSNRKYKPTVITSSLDKNKLNEEFVKRIKSPCNNPFLWTLKIIPTLLKSIHNKSFIIITGSPFALFWLIFPLFFFKKNIILDFRDPYSNNPIHIISPIKKRLKNVYEYLVCLMAYKVITVNEECSKLINCNHKKMIIIENGFNENIVNKIDRRVVVEKTISYSGKLSQGRDLNDFIEKMRLSPSLKDFKIVYTGPDFSKIKYKDQVISYGQVSYEKNLEIISSCEFTLLLFAGHSFESSTKIFDYIGLKKPIIVHSSNGIKHGAIAKIMTKYSNSFYFEYENIKDIDLDIDNYKFSRLYGLNKLINILDKI